MTRWRSCVCGTRIAWNRTLCHGCLTQYGEDRNAWPKWLRAWVKDAQREIDAKRNHDEWEYYESKDYRNQSVAPVYLRPATPADRAQYERNVFDEWYRESKQRDHEYEYLTRGRNGVDK